MSFTHFVLAAVSLAALLPAVLGTEGDNRELRNAFAEFVAKFKRSYATDEERATRFAAFASNFARIEAANAAGHGYSLGINEFADMAPEEFAAGRFGLSASPAKAWEGLTHLGSDVYSGAALPEAVDWIEKGAVTEPKNQKSCGSCWSFSTTGALEGAWQIATGKLVSLSEQQLVDCSSDNHGCQGGSMDLAFQFLEKQALCTEDSYAYKAQQGTCQESSCTVGIPKGSIKGFKDVPAKDTQALMEAVAKQPVSVAIEADESAFQLYRGGVLTQKCGNKLDHGVLLVGYGTEDGVDYWKVKNSWGASWGEQGYIRIKRGVPGDGECGIKDGAVYPIVSSASGATLLVV